MSISIITENRVCPWCGEEFELNDETVNFVTDDHWEESCCSGECCILEEESNAQDD